MSRGSVPERERVRIGVVGGSGLYDIEELVDREEVTLSTPFGEPSAPYLVGTLDGQRVAFLARHGPGHRLLPSELNFRANIFGFKMLGVEWLVFPWTLRSPQPWSSARITTMLGWSPACG